MPISNEVWALLSGPTVTEEMSKDPSQTPGKLGESMFSKKAVKSIEQDKAEELGDSEPASYDKMHKKANLGLPADGSEELKAMLDRAATTGKFPYRPGDLFLKVCVFLRPFLFVGQLSVVVCHYHEVTPRPSASMPSTDHDRPGLALS